MNGASIVDLGDGRTMPLDDLHLLADAVFALAESANLGHPPEVWMALKQRKLAMWLVDCDRGSVLVGTLAVPVAETAPSVRVAGKRADTTQRDWVVFFPKTSETAPFVRQFLAPGLTLTLPVEAVLRNLLRAEGWTPTPGG